MKIVIDIPKERYEYIQNLPHYKRNYEQDIILDGDIIEESEEEE